MSDVMDLAALDKRHLWHPFTQMAEWDTPAHEPLVIVSGRGSWLQDQHGNTYFDGNSSIWTNIHGHNHPKINEAIRRQLDKVAHTSFLGAGNEPASLLGARLLALYPGLEGGRVFYSDNGSTAIEVAVKLAIQFRQLTGEPWRREFVSFDRAYHGDTMGAASLGGVPAFFDRFSGFHFPSHRAGSLTDLYEKIDPAQVTAVVIEPLVQGVAGMRPWPQGMLKELRAWCDRHGVLLIADEIMTGFGRTGKMFACPQEEVVPDMVALAKGLTGGYLPLAATLVSHRIYEAFLGDTSRTFYYGHSYTANPLGCAAALASLEVFEEERTLDALAGKIEDLRRLLDALASHPCVAEVRQTGFIAGIEIAMPDGTPFPPEVRAGAAACLAARKHKLLTRPILDTIVLMPPLCSSTEDLAIATDAIAKSLDSFLVLRQSQPWPSLGVR